MLFMELSVGQFSGRGPIGALGQLSPLFKGKEIKVFNDDLITSYINLSLHK